MGGRGASSGISDKGLKYGSEYRVVLKNSNIKFVKQNKNTSVKAPIETKTKGRVYVTVSNDNRLKAITYFDDTGKRKKTIDLDHEHNKKQPHTHHGYFHNERDGERGATSVNKKERQMVDRVLYLWKNKSMKQ